MDKVQKKNIASVTFLCVYN